MIRHSFCLASSWKIGPRYWRILPKITLRRYLGTNTTWYLQSHLEWDRLWHNSDMLFPATVLLHQATVEVTLLSHRSKLFKSHWSNQWLSSSTQWWLILYAYDSYWSTRIWCLYSDAPCLPSASHELSHQHLSKAIPEIILTTLVHILAGRRIRWHERTSGLIYSLESACYQAGET